MQEQNERYLNLIEKLLKMTKEYNIIFVQDYQNELSIELFENDIKNANFRLN